MLCSIGFKASWPDACEGDGNKYSPGTGGTTVRKMSSSSSAKTRFQTPCSQGNFISASPIELMRVSNNNLLYSDSESGTSYLVCLSEISAGTGQTCSCPKMGPGDAHVTSSPPKRYNSEAEGADNSCCCKHVTVSSAGSPDCCKRLPDKVPTKSVKLSDMSRLNTSELTSPEKDVLTVQMNCLATTAKAQKIGNQEKLKTLTFANSM